MYLAALNEGGHSCLLASHHFLEAYLSGRHLEFFEPAKPPALWQSMLTLPQRT